MKKCNICGEDRIEEFYKHQRTRCKACQKAKQYEFNRKNPDYLKAKNQRRRAKKLALPNDLTTDQWKAILDRFENNCAISDSTDIVLEHVIPLNFLHMGTSVNNVIPMDKTLNLSKRDKNILEWVLEPEVAEVIYWGKFEATMKYLAEVNGMTVEEYYEFIYFCEYNKRTVEEVKSESRSSVELFKADI
ncbi:hypothetical protein NDK43_26025 [Neobacillus pocheonensis]|uniref:HNH endonuclease n=1 Tax=Neobacillus pocheonensis TaxID=363869 RepID=A0ABT0WFS5_9BACI|nr:hypothetical protein [Neobacillus pocheonensis]